jgi:hypothetical protein
MPEKAYLNFDVQIEPAAAGFRIEVNSPAGQLTSAFVLPFSDLEVENFLLRLGQGRRTMRRFDSPEVEAAKAFGARLFDAVFAHEGRACLRGSLDEAERRGMGLRIRLRLTTAPALADLPWEYLYNSTLNRFPVLSNETPIVRYLDLPESIRPLAITPPLRVLAIIASPQGYAPLNVEREWARLQEALRELQERELVVLERLEEASLPALQRRLRRGDYHILHFMGHGGFDERTQDGVLILEHADGSGYRISGQDLGMLLHDHRSLRLVLLNACEGARTSRTDPFAGTAQSLVQQGIPAVIAMQFEVSDEAAVVIAHEFYGAIADGYPVDAGLAEARKSLFATGSGVEWGTPVLYLRAPDGKIFDIVRRPRRTPKPPVAQHLAPIMAEPPPSRVVVATDLPPLLSPAAATNMPPLLSPEVIATAPAAAARRWRLWASIGVLLALFAGGIAWANIANRQGRPLFAFPTLGGSPGDVTQAPTPPAATDSALAIRATNDALIGAAIRETYVAIAETSTAAAVQTADAAAALQAQQTADADAALQAQQTADADAALQAQQTTDAAAALQAQQTTDAAAALQAQQTAEAQQAETQAALQQTEAARPTATPRPTRAPTATPEPQVDCRVQGRSDGNRYVGTCRSGARLAGRTGSCITGRVLARDGTPFKTILLSVDIKGNTIRVPLDGGGYDPGSGGYEVCGLSGGEWGVALININRGIGIEENPDGGRDQVILRLNGLDGEHAIVNIQEQ